MTGATPTTPASPPGTSNQFFGTPVAFKNTDGISGGGAFAGARILVGYDRQLLKKVGLTLGLRIGYAFGGPSAPENLINGQPPPLVGGGEPPQNVALGFAKYHAEARLSYFIFNSMMEDKKLRPYVFVGGGAGQVNASVSVAICDSNITAADATLKTCQTPGVNSVVRSVNAYQVTGLGFAEFGAGTTFGITPLFGLAAELKFMFMVPTFGVVISPNIGPVFNF